MSHPGDNFFHPPITTSSSNKIEEEERKLEKMRNILQMQREIIWDQYFKLIEKEKKIKDIVDIYIT
jgi:hypothetical protein